MRPGSTFSDLQDDKPVKLRWLKPMGNGPGAVLAERISGPAARPAVTSVGTGWWIFGVNKSGVPGKVLAVSYDPNRSRTLALVSVCPTGVTERYESGAERARALTVGARGKRAERPH